MSQYELAAVMNVPRTYISKLERSYCLPGVSSVLRIAEGLRVPAELLMVMAEIGPS
jgi:transcriptional regulator with XRE-family HTH domain